MHFTVINGPNLNLLGTREPVVYGSDTLADLERRWRALTKRLNAGLDAYQSNHEGSIIDAIHKADRVSDGIVLNAGALTHYSYAIHDAVRSISTPVVELHISNIKNREEWRRTSVIEEVCEYSIMGRGVDGYLDAISHLWALAHAPSDVAVYGDHADAFLDLRVPDNPDGWAMLVHGGFWREVYARDTLDRVAVDLMRRNYAVANIEYSRGPGTYPGAVRDVDAAATWLFAHAASLGMAVDRLGVIGHSAGGYLATKLAETRDDIAAVAVGPALDLPGISAIREDDPPGEFLGATQDEAPDLWREAAPAGPFRSPVHIVHGRHDDIVPASHSEAFAANHDVALSVVEDGDHFDVVDPLEPAYETVVDALTSS